MMLLLALLAVAPDCSILPGFTQSGPVRSHDVETLYEYMNGNSEGYFLYGFKVMKGVTCTRGGLRVVFDVSEFESPELAYGMFTGNSDPRAPREKIGAVAQVVPTKAIFVKGPYYVELSAEPQGDHAAMLRAAAQAFEPKVPGSTGAPAAMAWFPRESMDSGFPRLIPQSLLGMRMLGRGYLAQYGSAKAFVSEQASPQAAAALLVKLKERFPPTGAPQIGDEAFVTEDKYLGKACFFRKGARVGGFTNVPAAQDPAALAAKLAAGMP